MKNNLLLVEISWEAANQAGGVYTVIRTKVPAVLEDWDDRYCLIGPYFPKNVLGEFEDSEDDSIFFKAVQTLRSRGVDVKYGRWLVSGQPRIVLLNIASYESLPVLRDISNFLGINAWSNDLVKQTSIFGFLAQWYVGILSEQQKDYTVIAHFHEWMSAAAIQFLKGISNLRTVFLTHATMLGRYQAAVDPGFYDKLNGYNWESIAKTFNIYAEAVIERQAAHNCHILTTVSGATDRECSTLLGRKADFVLPNGLNIHRFRPMHELQNLHGVYKNYIRHFVIAHFFRSYSFDLDKTLYFFNSGRYEYSNKGFDFTIDALHILNERMKAANSPMTVVFFFITRRDCLSINPDVLESQSLMAEVYQLQYDVLRNMREQLYLQLAASTGGELPDLNALVPEPDRLRLRRAILQWKRTTLPQLVTHILADDQHDQLLNYLRHYQLWNRPEDRVKVIYHPDFITISNPLFGLDYQEFIRGCHLGVFPSYYEPWGYTPLEALASAIPTVTSDLAGFGQYVQENIPQERQEPVKIIARYRRDYWQSVNELADYLYNFCNLDRHDRIALRNQAEELSAEFDWKRLYRFYEGAYLLALERYSGTQ